MVKEYSEHLTTRAQRVTMWSDRIAGSLIELGDSVTSDAKPLPARFGRGALAYCKVLVSLVPAIIAETRFTRSIEEEIPGSLVERKPMHDRGIVGGVNYNIPLYRMDGAGPLMIPSDAARHIVTAQV